MGLLKEFKEFAVKGNVVDLAVGVIIGAAFGQIVQSLVRDVIMPPIGMATGGVSFTDKFVILDSAKAGTNVISTLAQARSVGVPVLAYGSFLQYVIDFLIVAFSVFMMVKAINHMRRRFEKEQRGADKAPPSPTATELLLTEIRDLLKRK